MPAFGDLGAIPLTVGQACLVAGCSYRQFDTWSRSGLLSVKPAPGSGHHRRLNGMHALELAVLVQCARAGLRPGVLDVDLLTGVGRQQLGARVAIEIEQHAVADQVRRRIEELVK